MSLTETDVSDYLAYLYLAFPGLGIHSKRPWWLKLAFKAMFWNKGFDGFTTTIGMNIWLSPNWETFSPIQKLSILRHEKEHLKQFKKYTLPLAAIIYLFLPLPCIFALGRAYFEKAGYDESIRSAIEYRNPSEEMKNEYREWYIKHFTGPSYFYMFPFKSIVSKWFDKVWSESRISSSD